MPQRPPVYRPPIPGGIRKTAQRSGDRNRAHSRARGYDRTWERLRRKQLSEFPLCAKCLEKDHVRAATVADHVVPISVDPTRRLDQSNLQSLCKPHHDSAKQREDRALRKSLEGDPDDQ
jgi:5-methylcytosine-specific restriction enzyme A